MSTTLYESDEMIITRYGRGSGKLGIQVTPLEGPQGGADYFQFDYSDFIDMCKQVLKAVDEWPTIEVCKDLIPFHLDRAKAGDSVKTRNGEPVKILSFDLVNNDYELVGLIRLANGLDHIAAWTCEGKFSLVDEDGFDLFMSPQTQPDQKPIDANHACHWINIYKHNSGYRVGFIFPYNSKESALHNITDDDYHATIPIYIPK